MNKARKPSPVYRVLSAPVRWLQKAFTTLSLHTSSWFIGLTSSWAEGSYQNLANRLMTNPIGYRCYRLIADTMSSVELFAATMDAEMELERVDDHPFAERLKRPNADEPSYQTLVMRIIADLFFGGELFVFSPRSPLTGPNAGLPTEADGLMLIRPDRVFRIERDRETGMVAWYHWIADDGRRRKTDAARIQHIRLHDPRSAPGLERGERGFPIALAVWQELQLMAGGNDWNKSVFENKGRIPGFFKYTGAGKFTTASYEMTKDHIQQAYRNDAEKAMPGLLAGDYDFMETGTNQKEADWLKGAQQYARWIAVGLGVDPALLGDQGSRTLANLEIAIEELYTLTVLPLLDWLVEEFNARYMTRYGEALLYINREGIDALQENRGEAATRAVSVYRGGIATREEARLMIGMDAEADGTFFTGGAVPEEEEATRLDMLSDEQLFSYVKTLIPNGAA